jgi:hypothetical protein
MATLPSLKSLAELPDVPAPLLAIVGAGDATVKAARDLTGKIAQVDTTALKAADVSSLDPRKLDLAKVDLSKLDPRTIDPRKLDPRTIDTAALTSTGLVWAAKGQEAYEGLVARGEAVIAKSRTSDEWSDAVAADAPIVAEPPAAPAAKRTTSSTKKASTKTPPSDA